MITNMFNASHKILKPLEEKHYEVLSGLSERLPYIIEMIHRTGYVFIANMLSKKTMGSVTVALNKRISHHLWSTVDEVDREVSLSMCDFVRPNLYRASFECFFGTSFDVDTYNDFRTMDEGMLLLFNNMSILARESIKARSDLAASLESYVRCAWENDNGG